MRGASERREKTTAHRDDRIASTCAIEPTATILPSAKPATRSQIVSSASMSWVTMNTVRPSVRCKVRISTPNSPAAIGSRPEVGSSRNTIAGIERQGAGERDAFGHAARKLRGLLVAVLGFQSHHFQLYRRDLSHQPRRQPQIFAHREFDVLKHRER